MPFSYNYFVLALIYSGISGLVAKQISAKENRKEELPVSYNYYVLALIYSRIPGFVSCGIFLY